MNGTGIPEQSTPLPPHGGNTIKLVIVSEIRFLREALGEILGRDGATSVVGLCADLPGAIAVSQSVRPDFVLLDAAFPNGIAAVARIRHVMPPVRVVALAVTETEETVIAWAEAGVAGYVPNTAALSDLMALLMGIRDGEQTCSARVAGGLLRRIGSVAAAIAPQPPSPLPPLTAREKQILDLLEFGCANKEIARKLDISLATAKSHVHNLLAKLKIQRRGQAAVWLRQHRADQLPQQPAPQP